MVSKDLTAYLAPDLELPYDGKTYVVRPPSVETGLKLSAIHAYATAGAAGAEALQQISPERREIAESLQDTDLGELSLGAAYQEMRADEVPGPHLDMFALYAMYYWVLGEDVADKIMELRAGGSAGPKAPQDHKPPKSGRSMGRARSSATTKTGSRSSSGTKASRAKSAPAKAPKSGGQTSSTTGT